MNVDLQQYPWYAVVNDLIGGWCVHTVDVTCSQLDYEHREDHREVATFMDEATARYIAELHNERRGRSDARPRHP